MYFVAPAKRWRDGEAGVQCLCDLRVPGDGALSKSPWEIGLDSLNLDRFLHRLRTDDTRPDVAF